MTSAQLKKKYGNFSIQAKKLGIALTSSVTSQRKIREYLKDKKVIIVAKTNGHNYGEIGETLVFTDIMSASITSSTITRGVSSGNSIYHTEFAVLYDETVEDIKENIKRTKEEIKALKEEITYNESKISYIEETGVEKFDENEFKVYSTLKLLSTEGLSDLEKSKIIAKLISN